MPPDGVSQAQAPPRSHLDLFLGFLAIGARSFGGVMPWAYRVMVEERRWLSVEDFTETIALCQFLPGPNPGNVSVVLGKRWFGLTGAAVGVLGLYALPLVWMLALAALYADFALVPVVHSVITGVGVEDAFSSRPEGRRRRRSRSAPKTTFFILGGRVTERAPAARLR